MPLNGKRGDNMATSSITANFYCDNAKAANTFVDLLLSENPPAKYGWLLCLRERLTSFATNERLRISSSASSVHVVAGLVHEA